VRLGRIDQAIALIGPNMGISPSLGLLDATGRPLASAIAARGVSPRNGQVHSIAELEAWLDRGPLALDGARWFGEGHWFVATGYDTAGTFIRDSSGWDTRYLSWSRLHGEAGFSGWLSACKVVRRRRRDPCAVSRVHREASLVRGDAYGSPFNIETHIAHAYRKLGIPRR